MNLVKEKVAEMKGIPEEKELVEALQKAIFESRLISWTAKKELCHVRKLQI